MDPNMFEVSPLDPHVPSEYSAKAQRWLVILSNITFEGW